ncbi:MAG: oligosaccharide flippase family protein [Bacteroidales bacterium]|nr:oligosaccharide flippase family protein [Bacteroidales bacterium]
MKDTLSNRKLIINNSFSGVAQKIMTMLLVFLSIPIFISHLGVENYGLFTIVSVIGNLNVFAGFGLNTALIVSLTSSSDKEKSSVDIVTSLLMMIVLSSLIALLLFIFKIPILHLLLNLTESQLNEASVLFNYLLVSNILLFAGQAFSAALDSCQKIYFTNLIQFIYNVIYWLGLIIVVCFKGSLPEIGMMSLFASVVWFVIGYIITKNVFGRIYFSKDIKSYFESAQRQFKYGFSIYISTLTGFVFEPLSKLLLSKFFGLGAVSLFEIALKIRSNINELLIKFLYPLVPYIASSEETESLFIKLKDLSRKIEYFSFQLSAFLVFLLPPLLSFWIPKEMFLEFPPETIYLFTVSLTVSLLLFSPGVYPIYVYLSTKNKASKTINIQMISVVVNLLLFFALYKYVGSETIVISNSAGYFFSFILCIWYQKKYWNDSITNVLKYMLYLTLSVFPILIVGSAINVLVGNLILRIIIIAFLLPIISIFISKRMGLMSANDINRYLPYDSFLRTVLIKIFDK